MEDLDEEIKETSVEDVAEENSGPVSGVTRHANSDDDDTKDHLSKLEKSDEQVPFGVDLHGDEHVVEVHEGMDEVVHQAEVVTS